MLDDIKVHVRGPADRTHWILQWQDPLTGKTKSKSSGVVRRGLRKDRAEAERVAAKLQAELQEGHFPSAGQVRWELFRERYEREHAAGLARESQAKIGVVLGLVERLLNPRYLRDLNETRLSQLVPRLRDEGKSDSTIHSYLATLRAAINWGVQQKLAQACPALPAIRRRRKSGSGSMMKGRAPSEEEFARMLEVTPSVVGPAAAPFWTRYLNGLWYGGLRLRESLEFWWDRPDKLQPCFPEDGRPLIHILGEHEKAHTDRLLPMAPEFAKLLLATPEAERTGPVFSLPGLRSAKQRPSADWVGKTVTRIGRAADVRVRVEPNSPDQVKFASAHDLRRAFGERWAARVMPPQLQELMRHASIETTLKYYVAANAVKTAEACWQAFERGPARAGGLW